MDFNSLKQKAKEMADKAKQVGKDTIQTGAKKLSESQFFLKNMQEAENFLESSRNTIKTLENGEKKEFTKHVIILFCEKNTPFFESMLALFPVLATKAYSQNVALRLADKNMELSDKSLFGLTNSPLPQMILYENTSIKKIILGEENIQKVVKSLSLDITKTMLEL